MLLESILKIEGVVIRLIPMTSSSLVRWRGQRLGSDESLEVMHSSRGPVKMVREVTYNSLGGKYLVTFQCDQYSTVRFSKGCYGVGDSIEEAFNSAAEGSVPLSVANQVDN